METTHLPEAILTAILSRLPLRTISRLKSVCKTWKSILESLYFRRLFLSLHKNSSCSWSMMCETEELIGFHSCQTWDLPKSPASYIPNSHYVASSNGLVMIQGSHHHYDDFFCYVGSPVLQQWVKIPPTPDRTSVFGLLLSHLDEDGVVSSFKVFSLVSVQWLNDYMSETWSVNVYSSETGIWTSKKIHCPHKIVSRFDYMTLNGTVYFNFLSEPGVLAAYDFYSESNQFRIIQFPDHLSYNSLDFKRAFTTSGGFLMYMRVAQKEETDLKVWRLNNDSWHILWEIYIPTIDHYVPMAMHPFDSGVVYLWSEQNYRAVSCTLRTQSYRILRDAYNNDDNQGYLSDLSACDTRMSAIWGSSNSEIIVSVSLFQYMLPRWMDLVPRPSGQVEVIDTTSALSHISKAKRKRHL